MIARGAMIALCQTCGNRGPMPDAIEAIPDWCTCPRRGRHGPGPFVAPPGVIVCYTFESKQDAAFRETCRLAAKTEHMTRDAITDARWTDAGRKRPATHPRVRAAVKAYRKALRELEALQGQCSHPSRSIFNRIFCDVCDVQVECDVEHFRHLVREAGKRFAMRVAV
jgi:hypothetical protein